MFYFADLHLDNDFRLVVGQSGNQVIFCHHYRTSRDREAVLEHEAKYFPQLTHNPEKLTDTINRIEYYWCGVDVDLAQVAIQWHRGTRFQKDVWTTLRTVIRGQWISYRKLAQAAGYPGAQRAVGQAMAKNPFLLFVPCHRVLNSDGGIGGFGCGVEAKRKLLNIEKIAYKK